MKVEDINSYKKLYNKQKEIADIIFSLSYINEDLHFNNKVQRKLLKLDVYLKDGIYAEKLVKALISICLKVNLDIDENTFRANLTIEGEVWAEDIKLVSNKLIPEFI